MKLLGYIIGIILSCLLTSCAVPLTHKDKKKADVISCIKSLKDDDAETMESFEICRQIYGVKKVKE